MRDEVPPINLVSSRIPRDVFEGTYGITLPQPMEGEDPNRPPTSEELLNAYGCKIAFFVSSGLCFPLFLSLWKCPNIVPYLLF